MDEIGSIVASIAKTDRETQNVYLGALYENETLQDNKKMIAAQSITSLLSKNATRATGLRFLICSINQYPVDVLERKSIWLALVMKACNKKEICRYGTLIYQALALLIKKVQAISDLSKEFSTTHLSKFFGSLCLIDIKATPSHTIAALHAIEQCLKQYPGPSKSGKTPVMRFLKTNVDSSDPKVVQLSGECWLLLQQVHGGSSSNQWRDFQLELLGNLHDLLNETFVNCNDMYDGPVVETKFDYFPINLEADPIKRAAQVCRRFCNLTDYLKIALSEPFPTKKAIYLKKILNVIQRGLGVTYISLKGNPNIDNLCFAILLPQMQLKLLELLEVSMETCDTHIRLYYRLILELLMDSLKSTKSLLIGGKNNRLVYVRSKIYNVIALMCSILKEGSHCEIIAERLVPEIFTDVVPRRLDLSLVSRNKSIKNLPKGENKEKRSFKYHASQQNDDLIENSNQFLCEQALCCLQELVFAIGHAMKPSTLKNIHRCVLQICSQFYDLPMKEEHLYSNCHCRLQIYNTISALMTTVNYGCPPPAETMLYMLNSSSINDDSGQVRRNSLNIIRKFEIYLHPRKESLIFPAHSQMLQYSSIVNEQNSLNFENCEQNSMIQNNNVATFEDYENGPVNLDVDVESNNIPMPSEHMPTTNEELGVREIPETNLIVEETEELSNPNPTETKLVATMDTDIETVDCGVEPSDDLQTIMDSNMADCTKMADSVEDDVKLVDVQQSKEATDDDDNDIAALEAVFIDELK